MAGDAARGKRPGLWGVVRNAFTEFSNDDAMTHAGAVAFYAALSMAPLLGLLLWVASMLGEGTQQELIGQVRGVVGAQGGAAVDQIVETAEQKRQAGGVAGVIGILTLLFSASGVFGQLQHALNVIFDVEQKPGLGWKEWVRKRFLSFGMIITIGFLLLIAVAASTAITALSDNFVSGLPGADWIWQAVNFVVSFGVFVLLFAAMFKVLPDVRIGWRDVWVGAALTAALFTLGKFLIGLYLGMASVGSAYGAAGSLIALLLWVYYSSVIVFLGAEITQVWARASGREIMPSEHAVRADRSTNNKAEQGAADDVREDPRAARPVRRVPGRHARPHPPAAATGRDFGRMALGLLLLGLVQSSDRWRR